MNSVQLHTVEQVDAAPVVYFTPLNNDDRIASD